MHTLVMGVCRRLSASDVEVALCTVPWIHSLERGEKIKLLKGAFMLKRAFGDGAAQSYHQPLVGNIALFVHQRLCGLQKFQG